MALRLDPLAPDLPYWGLGEVHLLMGTYDEAVRYLKRSLEANPKNVDVLRDLAFCYVALERNEDASAVAAEILKLNPMISVNKWLERIPLNQDLKKKMQAALLKIGLPE
jgi:tetratricopeptide (TPR) repeat protein